MPEVNHLAVIVASIGSMLLGGIWYSPILFLKPWLKATRTEQQEGHSPIVFAVSFLLTLLSGYAFAIWLGPDPLLQQAIGWGAAVGLFFVAASFGINNRFAGESIVKWGIDGGYHVVRFMLFGLVLGLWH